MQSISGRPVQGGIDAHTNSIADMHGAFSIFAATANGNGDGVAVLTQSDARSTLVCRHFRPNTNALAIPPPTATTGDVFQDAHLILLDVGAVGKGGVNIFEGVAVRKTDGDRPTIAGKGRMGCNEVREARFDGPRSVNVLIHPSTEDQRLGIPAQLDTEVKIIRAQHVVLLDPLRFIGTELKDRGDTGADAANGVGIVRHGQGGAVGAEADGAGSPYVDDARAVHPPLSTEELVGDDRGLAGVGHGDSIAVGAEDGHRAGEGAIDEVPGSVRLTPAHLDSLRPLGADGNVGGVAGEGYGGSQRVEIGVLETHVLEPGYGRSRELLVGAGGWTTGLGQNVTGRFATIGALIAHIWNRHPSRPMSLVCLLWGAAPTSSRANAGGNNHPDEGQGRHQHDASHLAPALVLITVRAGESQTIDEG
mmetsp:Transcript_12535/g.35855  ORF Transcript_12535/g.35855 Transcript_12535/m.35855 type:complete len:420 (-) Transcript_12535:38-1297(-)